MKIYHGYVETSNGSQIFAYRSEDEMNRQLGANIRRILSPHFDEIPDDDLRALEWFTEQEEDLTSLIFFDWDVIDAEPPAEEVSQHCHYCNSDMIEKRMSADWDIQNQRWRVDKAADQLYCANCDADIDITIPRPIAKQNRNLMKAPDETSHANPDAMKEAIKSALPHLDAEIEQRKHGGNDELWNELQGVYDKLQASIAHS